MWPRSELRERRGTASLSLFFIDGLAGGKDTVRGRAASFASEEDGIAVPISL